MPDEPDPPRKFYTLKAKEIERLNPPAGQAPQAAAINVKDHFKDVLPLHRPRPIPGATPPPNNDVQTLVRTNAHKEHAAGLNDVAIGRPRRASRRKLDYFTTILVGNGIILGAVALAGLNPICLLFGFAGIVLFTATSTWIIWVVMDDY